MRGKHTWVEYWVRVIPRKSEQNLHCLYIHKGKGIHMTNRWKWVESCCNWVSAIPRQSGEKSNVLSKGKGIHINKQAEVGGILLCRHPPGNCRHSVRGRKCL